jgi:hypothetical protein
MNETIDYISFQKIDYIAIAFGVFGLLSGWLTWALNMKVKNDIMMNNAKTAKDMDAIKDSLTRSINAVNDNFIKELSTLKDKITNQLDGNEHNISELKNNLTDRILATVNGKYVRTELHDQSIDALKDRLSSFKQLIENSMSRIEQNLDRQISDLKDRIFHNNT